MNLRMLDLFSGLGGASAAMRDRGWEVTTLDNNPDFKPDIVADIGKFSWEGGPLDLIWASPPCEEFSREFMPWCKTGVEPSMGLVEAAYRVIQEAAPRFWVIENTRGAVKWFRPLLGPPAWISNPIYLWGYFPPFPKLRLKMRKEKMSSSWAAERAKIPYEVSLALAISVEGAFDFFKSPFHPPPRHPSKKRHTLPPERSGVEQGDREGVERVTPICLSFTVILSAK